MERQISRKLKEAVVKCQHSFEHDEEEWRLSVNGFLGRSSMSLMRDNTLFSEPSAFHPGRYKASSITYIRRFKSGCRKDDRSYGDDGFFLFEVFFFFLFSETSHLIGDSTPFALIDRGLVVLILCCTVLNSATTFGRRKIASY